MIVPANHNISVSTNPHSLSQRGSIEIPDNGNPLVAEYKNTLMSGMRGLAGIGGIAKGLSLGCCGGALAGVNNSQMTGVLIVGGILFALSCLPVFSKK